VTEDNIGSVEDVTRWFFNNADAFRLLSFLPVADVGRTRKSQGAAERDGLWQQIDAACGQKIHRIPLQFGHRECNNLIPLLLVNVKQKLVIIEAVREGNAADEKMLSRSIDAIGRSVVWELPWQKNILKVLKILLTQPVFAFQSLTYALRRVWTERKKLREILQLMIDERQLPSFNPFLFVIHSFMSPGDLLTQEGKDRLCVK